MSSEQNILVLMGSFNMGGAESQAVQLVRLLLESGRFRVHLACLTREGVLLEEALQLGLREITEFPLTSFYDRNMVVQLRRFRRFLKERKITVAHSQDFYMNTFGILGAALSRVPVRIAFCGEMVANRTPAHRILQRTSLRLATAIHANSEAVKRDLMREGVAAAKITVVYNGLDLARVRAPREFQRAEALAAFGLPTSGRRFVTIVANLRHEVKDHPMFLRAARRVREAVPGAAFIIAGEGELEGSIRALAAELGLERDTFFTGRCERLAEMLALSEVCVLSSKSEGFSNSILEYMGAGRAVVVTDVGGAREVVTDGETGYVVASGDDAAMAERIISLLQDPSGARLMGERGRQLIERKFSSRAQLENTERLYETLLAELGPNPAQLARSVRREGA
ncbi:MAG TPA: glycosyltransferase [Pyrinomonadaceae bacterium]|jgi:glycosyltransferase involved in cell wall biosynthesis